MQRRVFLATAVAAASARASGPRKLYLQPLGRRLPAEDTAMVRTALDAFFSFEVIELAPLPLPKRAWYAPRKRWRAEKLLDYLAAVMPKDGDRILGLCAPDISTTKGKHKDWGIMGLGSVGGRECVVSRFRCKRGARSRAHTRERLAKVCVHEIGHTLGSGHCPTSGCLMEDARGRVSTVDDEHTFCAKTRALFRTRGFALDEAPQPPWR